MSACLQVPLRCGLGNIPSDIHFLNCRREGSAVIFQYGRKIVLMLKPPSEIVKTASSRAWLTLFFPQKSREPALFPQHPAPSRISWDCPVFAIQFRSFRSSQDHLPDRFRDLANPSRGRGAFPGSDSNPPVSMLRINMHGKTRYLQLLLKLQFTGSP